MTTAFVNTRPVPSINFPNLMALVAAMAVEDVARTRKTSSTLALGMGNSWSLNGCHQVSPGAGLSRIERGQRPEDGPLGAHGCSGGARSLPTRISSRQKM